MKKPTKKETQKVVTAVAKMFWANREDMPYVASKEYHFQSRSGDYGSQEIHWEGGDYEWTSKFSAFFNDAQDEFYVEPYNGFVLFVWKREDVALVKNEEWKALDKKVREARKQETVPTARGITNEDIEWLKKYDWSVIEKAAREILTNPVRDGNKSVDFSLKVVR